MSFYTQQCINSYRAGWMEEHPDEELDDATVISCLNDEHEALIDKLIADDFKKCDASELLERALRHGFAGYSGATVTELWEEMSERGLEL